MNSLREDVLSHSFQHQTIVVNLIMQEELYLWMKI